jgi:hypothetical protein
LPPSLNQLHPPSWRCAAIFYTQHKPRERLHAPHAGLMSAESQKRPSQTAQEQKSSVHIGSDLPIFMLQGNCKCK